MEITLAGEIIESAGSPFDGMVMDFSEVKAIATKNLIDVWDHAFLAWRRDELVVRFLSSIPGHKTVLMDVVPTAENLAIVAFRILEPLYRDRYRNHLELERVRLFETPNCWADAVRGEIPTN